MESYSNGVLFLNQYLPQILGKILIREKFLL